MKRPTPDKAASLELTPVEYWRAWRDGLSIRRHAGEGQRRQAQGWQRYVITPDGWRPDKQ